jgi:hypothetical protein
MKKIFILLFSVIAFASCQSNDTAMQTPSTYNKVIPPKDPNKQYAAIKFDTIEHDFGKVTEGDKPEYDFRFTNTSNVALVLSDVHATCGCTTPYWPKTPIQPGKSDVIKVMYNSEGRNGIFHKGVVVNSNAYPPQTLISIKGEVISKK